jgi:hypothetical protein
MGSGGFLRGIDYILDFSRKIFLKNLFRRSVLILLVAQFLLWINT